MLVSAAAQRWNVDPASCPAQSGEVLHPPTGRRVKYGDLAADAMLGIPQTERDSGADDSADGKRLRGSGLTYLRLSGCALLHYLLGEGRIEPEAFEFLL